MFKEKTLLEKKIFYKPLFFFPLKNGGFSITFN